jgi:hypothetical protein
MCVFPYFTLLPDHVESNRGLTYSYRYKVDYLSAESAFIFNIKFMACFESKGDCMLNIPIMQDVKIPLLPCNFTRQPFAIPGEFSVYIDKAS